MPVSGMSFGPHDAGLGVGPGSTVSPEATKVEPVTASSATTSASDVLERIMMEGSLGRGRSKLPRPSALLLPVPSGLVAADDPHGKELTAAAVRLAEREARAV